LLSIQFHLPGSHHEQNRGGESGLNGQTGDQKWLAEQPGGRLTTGRRETEESRTLRQTD
jgi:hypothetical protein